jgi:hypothetical protein
LGQAGSRVLSTSKSVIFEQYNSEEVDRCTDLLSIIKKIDLGTPLKALDRKRLDDLRPFEIYVMLKQKYNIIVDYTMIKDSRLNIDIKSLGIDVRTFMDQIPKPMLRRIRTYHDIYAVFDILANDSQNYKEESIESKIREIHNILVQSVTFYLTPDEDKNETKALLGLIYNTSDKMTEFLRQFVHSQSTTSAETVRLTIECMNMLCGAKYCSYSRVQCVDKSESLDYNIKEFQKSETLDG